MGNANTRPKKHLVIIGGSFAGILLLEKVSSEFNVTLIEKKDHFEWICSLPKSIINNEYFENDATIMYKDMIETNRVFGDNVQYLQGMATQIVDDHTLKIKRTDHVEELKTIDDIPEETINYDYLAICTGTHFKINEPQVDNVFNLFTKKQRSDFLKSYADKIDNAQSILVVGGGATGTEFLGEIQQKYGNSKKYGLINNQAELLSPFERTLRRKAYNHFDSKNVEIYLEQRYDPDSDLAKDYDLTLTCVGLNYHTPFMDNDTFKDFKSPRGQIYVNEYFQICNKDPSVKKDKNSEYKVYDNIFCYGDASLTCMNEPKNVPSIRSTSYTVSNNLKQLAKDSNKLESMPYAVDNMAGVYFSKCSGGLQLNNFSMRLPCTLMMKNFIEGSFMCFMRGKCCGKCRYKLYNCSVNCSMCCFNNCLCCCSCSNRKARTARREYLRNAFKEE